jgi:membrane protease YdiL (CAAX protease family)
VSHVGPAGLLYLVLVGLWVPYLALKSAYRLRGGAPLPISRTRFFISTTFMLLFLFAIALATAMREWIDLTSMPRDPLRAWSYAALLLVVLVVTLRMRWKTRPREGKERLFAILPHDGREYALYAVVCLTAGIGEEAVYRGVLAVILQRLVGSWLIAILIASFIFAISHAIQGTRAVIAIFIISIGSHALVAIAQSLLPMIVVHATYDAIAGFLIPRWYRREQ